MIDSPRPWTLPERNSSRLFKPAACAVDRDSQTGSDWCSCKSRHRLDIPGSPKLAHTVHLRGPEQVIVYQMVSDWSRFAEASQHIQDAGQNRCYFGAPARSHPDGLKFQPTLSAVPPLRTDLAIDTLARAVPRRFLCRATTARQLFGWKRSAMVPKSSTFSPTAIWVEKKPHKVWISGRSRGGGLNKYPGGSLPPPHAEHLRGTPRTCLAPSRLRVALVYRLLPTATGTSLP
jgi:hypothetical protein